MTQVGEPVFFDAVLPMEIATLGVLITSITFDSGIKIFDVESGGGEPEVPAAGEPHWSMFGSTSPAVYVRQGGTGETKNLKVDLGWLQVGYDGAAELKGESADGKIVIEGSFSISGMAGTATVDCKFTKKPSTVANYGDGITFEWTVSAGGHTVVAVGGGTLRLFFVDAKPKPVGWPWYKHHYLKVIDWATEWAEGQAGETAVRDALWDKFSDGTEARNPHATGFSYWKTNAPVQDLKTLLQPDGGVLKKGWSCRAIAHLFMECLAINGIKCLEVIPETAPGTRMFLVHNWDVDATPVPNWGVAPGVYYAGSWRPTSGPPLNAEASTTLMQHDAANLPTRTPLRIDMKKRPGVTAQGQGRAPLGFSNHWIVETGGKLYDSSYGLIHPNDIDVYAGNSLAGWLMGAIAEPRTLTLSWLFLPAAAAWYAEAIGAHSLQRTNENSN